jgi:hypothetical protein
MLPSRDVLDFVEEEDRRPVEERLVGRQDVAERVRRQAEEPFVVEVDVADLLDGMPFREQLPRALVEKIRLTGVADSDHHVFAIRLERNVALDQFHRSDELLILNDDSLQCLKINHSRLLFTVNE